MKHSYQQFMGDDKLMPEIDIPPELQYTISYIELIAQAGMGKNASSETRAQALFPIGDVIKNLQIAEFCYPLKSALVLFLQHMYFDTDKKMSEDNIAQVWFIIDYLLDDIKVFVEVMQRTKRSNNANVGRGPAAGKSDIDLMAEVLGISGMKAIEAIQVDVNKNFDLVTAFGKFKISELMQTYVFDGIFPAIIEFFRMRLSLKGEQRSKIGKLLKCLGLCCRYPSKSSHEKRIQELLREIRANAQI